MAALTVARACNFSFAFFLFFFFFLQMFCVLALFLGVALAAGCPSEGITFQDASGNKYTYHIDSAMTTDKTKMIQGKESAGASQVNYLNVCGDASAAWGCTQPAPICQTDGTNPFAIGSLASWTISIYSDPVSGTPDAAGGVTVATGGGIKCQNGIYRNANLWLKCGQSSTPPATPVTVTEASPSAPSTNTPCSYYWAPISMSQFCPGAGGGSGGFDYGWVFVIIVLVGFFLYFVLGIIISRFGFHKEGREMIPQHEFWFGLPGLVLDGLKYAFCCVPCRGGSYTEV